jgi:hypothetical protein
MRPAASALPKMAVKVIKATLTAPGRFGCIIWP